MHLCALLTEVRERADFPEPPDPAWTGHGSGNRGILCQALENCQIHGFRSRGQLRKAGRRFQVVDQHCQTVEAGFRLAPEEPGERWEAMLFDRIDFLVGESGVVACSAGQRAEAAVALVAPRSPGDLRHFGCRQPPLAYAVEFRKPREGDMTDVKVQPHADGVGRNEIVDFARLIERHLRVARLRRHRAHDHRRSAAEAPQHLGDGIDLLSREGDDGAAGRDARQLSSAEMRKRGEAGATDDLGFRDESFHQRLECRGTEDHGFLAPAGIEQSVGEYMATLAVGSELRFVERDEGEIAIDRHGFGSAQQPAGVLGFDPLFAGDERDPVLSLDRADAIVDLSSEQAQRKADGAAGMAAEPLDSEVRLPGVRRSEHGLDVLGGAASQGGRQSVGHRKANVALPVGCRKTRPGPVKPHNPQARLGFSQRLTLKVQ